METKTKPTTEKPIAKIGIAITLFIPRPENPEVGDVLAADGMEFLITKPGTMPPGVIKAVRDVVSHCVAFAAKHEHAPAPVPSMVIAEPPRPDIITELHKPKGPPTAELFLNDGLGGMHKVRDMDLNEIGLESKK